MANGAQRGSVEEMRRRVRKMERWGVLAHDEVDFALREAMEIQGKRARKVRQILRGAMVMLEEGMG